MKELFVKLLLFRRNLKELIRDETEILNHHRIHLKEEVKPKDRKTGQFLLILVIMSVQ